MLEREDSSDTILREFQERHRTGNFLCRFRRCPRASLGFDSARLRQEHENGHKPRFQCTDSSCGFYGWTFETRALLRKHAVLYHDESAVASIPTTLDVGSQSLYTSSLILTLHRTALRMGQNPGRHRPPQIGSSALRMGQNPPRHRPSQIDNSALRMEQKNPRRHGTPHIGSSTFRMGQTYPYYPG